MTFIMPKALGFIDLRLHLYTNRPANQTQRGGEKLAGLSK